MSGESPRIDIDVGQSNAGVIQNFERAVLALLWMLLAFLKLGEPETLARFVQTQFSVPMGLADIVAWGIIFAELILGAALAVSVVTRTRTPMLRRLAPRVSLVAASCIIFTTLALDSDVSCGCLGALGSADRWQRVVLASALVFLSLGSVGRDSARGS